VAVKRLSLCIVLAVFAASTALALAPASAHAVGMTKPEKQMLALINHVRVQHHLAKLKMVKSLERASRAHSHEMVSRGYFSHSSYNGESFGARLIRFGYTTSGCTRWTVGEDIACGYGPGATVKAIFRAWMHSPAHRAVILTKRFRNVGIGRAKGTVRGISGMVFFTLDCGARTH
jgi:uncharacterized protein YkwD